MDVYEKNRKKSNLCKRRDGKKVGYAEERIQHFASP